MKENLKMFKCGGCECEDFKIYGENNNPHSIFVECQKCKSVSEVTKPRSLPLEIKWGDDSDGLMSIF